MFLEECDSSNTRLRLLVATTDAAPEYVYTGYQTAGRGQTGNGWESEKDKNLLCSILLKKRDNMFDLNVMISVSVHRVLSSEKYLGKTEDLSIKWPNDIYYGDKKLAGILVENAIVGNELRYSIAGIGLNVNQTVFVSNAPNPISIKKISGREYDIAELMQELMESVHRAEREEGESIRQYYLEHLYRRQGYWSYVEREVSCEPTMNAEGGVKEQFKAKIEDVTEQGQLVLRDEKGRRRIYHFKQVRYVV